MKISIKWIFLLLIAIGTINTWAQNLNEGFENSFIPEDWTILNYGDNNTFESYNSTSGAHSGNKSSKISYSATAHNDWLITPKLSIANTTDSIHFWARNQSASFLEEFHVKISTTGNDTASFTHIVELNASPTTTWQKYSYSLANYASQDIYVAIQAISTNEYGLFLDDFSGPTLFVPSCAKVDSITINSIDPNEADFSWPTVSGSINYLCEVYELGNSPSSSTPIFTSNTTTNTITTAGLTSSTNYTVFIKTICSTTDSSDYRSMNFETPCAPYSTLSEGFEGTNDLPDCWTAINNADLSYGSVKSVTYTNPAFGSKHLRLYNGASSTAQQFAATPQLSDLANGTHRLRFSAKCGANEKLVLGTFSIPNDESTFTAIDTIELTTSEVEYTHYFNNPISDKHIGFHLYATSSYKKIFIDEVIWEVIPSCIQPTEINLINAGTSTLNINWDNLSGASNFSVEYGVEGFTLGTGTTVISNTTSTTINSLLSATAYDFYIKAICSSTDTSIWSNKATFLTLCEPSIEILENFETTALNELPTCWNKIVNSSTGSPYVKTVNTGSPANGDQQISLYNSSAGSNVDLVLVSPELISSDNKRIKLYARGGGQIKLGTLTDPTDISTFSAIDSTDIVTVSNEYEFMVGTGNIGNYYGFKVEPTTNFTYSYIDSIRITELPTCIEPNSLQVSIMSETEVNLGWTTLGSETNWIVEYGQDGFTPGNGTVLNVNSNPALINGLNYGDTLQFYVRSICNIGDTSMVSSPITYIMECAPILTNYSEDFTNFLPECWSLANGTLSTATELEEDAGTSAQSWKSDGYLNVGTTGAVRMNVYGPVANHWLISPSINLEIGHSKSLEFDAALTDYNNSNAPDNGNFGPDDKMVVVISPDNGLTWSSANALITFDTNNAPLHTGQHYSIDLSSYTGQVKIGFYGESSVSNEDNDLTLDNFKVSETLVQPLNDIKLISIDMNETYCLGETVVPTITVENIGDVDLSTYDIELNILGPQVHFLNQTVNTTLLINNTDQINFIGISTLPAGLYAVVTTVTIPGDSTPLNNSLTFSFTVDEEETITLNEDITICEGESIVLQASGSNQLVWNNSLANGSSVSPNSTTNYSVTATSPNGCEITESFTVTVNSLPNFNIEFDNTTLSSSQTFVTYKWKLNGIQIGSTSTLEPTENGIYSLEVTNANGCSAIEEYTVSGLSVNPYFNEFGIYPNPTTEIIHLNNMEGESITVYSLSGEKLIKSKVQNGKISLEQLNTGVYILHSKKNNFQIKITKL